MAESAPTRIWESVIELTKEAQEKGSDPFLWAMQLSSYLNSTGGQVTLPSIELADVLVSYICWDNNVPILWKFLDKALVLNIVPPMLVLALLSTRVIPSRLVQPAAYRLFMELLKRHLFNLKSQLRGVNYQRVMQSIDTVLQLSQIFGMETSEAGAILVEFIFAIVWQLLDASLDDEGLLENTSERKPSWVTNHHAMEIDQNDNFEEKQNEHRERMKKLNTVMSIELIAQFLQSKVTSGILNLARQNMSTHWEDFMKHLQLLAANSSAIRDTKVMTPEGFLQLASFTHMVSREFKLKSKQNFHDTVAIRPLASSAILCNGATHSSLWLPLDLFLEDTVDSTEISATSTIENISGFIKILRAINCTTWHNTFLRLWIAALHLVQRERESIEAPRPRLDSRLCLLLSITPLVVADLIEEDESATLGEREYASNSHWKDKKVSGNCHIDLVSSLQMLGEYKSLLIPPESTVSAANQAAAKAIFFVSGINIENECLERINMKDMPSNYSGNMRHLVVEACIARNLLDTSAYFWPGYVNGNCNQIPQSVPAKVPGWSSLMQGAPLTPAMINALVSSPASSLAELERIFDIAVNGSNSEKASAAMILCGASLSCGWNLQEHTADFIVRLLSPPAPPAPPENSGSESHLIAYTSLLNELILGIASSDSLQIFSLHGLIPQLACSLMSICEVFGSCDVLCTTTTDERISPHVVFSNAFTVLLRLWRFNHPPTEKRAGDATASHPTLEYLLLLRNGHLLSPGNVHQGRNKRRLALVASSSTVHPIFVDSFPRLNVWYQQHLACICSTLRGLEGTPVHHIVDELLKIMFTNICRGSQSVHSVASGCSGFSGTGDKDTLLRLKLSAWDVLEAVPYVCDAVLTACDIGKLSPRELATGLKNLSDFLPASLAPIISYFSAEVTRGTWKPVSMNGTDWPSPDASLSNVEEQMKKIVASSGVDVPSVASGGSSIATLPLPLAAFVSFTLTFKASERFLSLANPALESLAAGCLWPCMPIVASLWTQKAKRWSDYFVFSASRSVFLQDYNAVFKLLQSCFTATLGFNANPISSSGCVGDLLGHGLKSHSWGGSTIAPGILFLHLHRSLNETILVTEHIISLLMDSVRTIATRVLPNERLGKLKTAKNTKNSGQVSLDAALTQVHLAASVGASLVWLSGGLGLVRCFFKETLPSWLLSAHRTKLEGRSEGMVEMLKGYALAYFAVHCGAFVWGVESSSMAPNCHREILWSHMEFIAVAFDRKVALNWATWRAYVSQFLSLMIDCAPAWVIEADADVLQRVSRGLRWWNREDLALALHTIRGVGAMGAVAELIIENQL